MAKVARPSAAEKQAATSLELIANLARSFWDDVAACLGLRPPRHLHAACATEEDDLPTAGHENCPR
jgi:hypothetical protein